MKVVEYENIRFTVFSVEERRIGKVRVEILPQGEAPVEEPDAGEKKRRRLLHERDAEETSEENAEPEGIKLLSFLHHKTKKARCIVVCSVPFLSLFFLQAAAFFSACSGGSSSGISLSFASSLRRLRS